MSFQPHDSPTGPSSSTYGSSDPHIQSATPLEEDDEKSDSDVDRNSDTMDNDDRDSQRDSAFEEDSLLGDDQASINSRISEYRMENGRRYHGYHDGSYWGPNDDFADDTQDLTHHMYLITMDGKLHLAPISNPRHILDVGCGNGIWAMDMAEEYPQAFVQGLDLSPTRPAINLLNCSFEIQDLSKEWDLPTNYYDFIHVRELFGSIPDWDLFFGEAYRHTRPGGWVHITEHSVQPISADGSVGDDHFYSEWGRTINHWSERTGKTFNIWAESRRCMETAGFVNVVEVHFVWPMNAWPEDPKLKELGKWNQLRVHRGVEGFALRILTSTGGLNFTRSQVFMHEMRSNVKDYSVKAFIPGTIVYGQRPLALAT